jgi:dolichyl-diphosphooligosaccharide--protein glycosyltransferase
MGVKNIAANQANMSDKKHMPTKPAAGSPLKGRWLTSDPLIAALILLAAFAIALYIRVALPYATVFAGQWIKLTGIDAYFYMRIVDNVVRNFPQPIGLDPYYEYPGLAYLGAPSFVFLIAGTIRLLAGASPSQQAADTIAVYIPAVMGALMVIPAFFIGRALANRWAGLIAAIAVAVMPGELLSRTLLGAVDHHVEEAFFSVFFVMFFSLAIQHGRQFTWAMLWKGQFAGVVGGISYSFLAGIFLGIYLISWSRSIVFLFIIFVFLIVQFISDHLRGFATGYLSKTAIICFVTALLIYFPVSQDRQALLALAAVILLPVALNIISMIMAKRGFRPAGYLAAVGGLLALGMLGAWLLFPDLLGTVLGQFSLAFSWNQVQAIESEMRPLFLQGSRFSLDIAWAQYALVLYSGLAALAVLIYNSARRGQAGHVFAAVWSIVIMFASFARIRNSFYFAICIAVLTGYLAGLIIEAALQQKKQQVGGKTRKKTGGAMSPGRSGAGRLAALLAVIAAVIILLTPGTAAAVNFARNPTTCPSDAWMEALDWMRKNSPEPFGSADYYYALYHDPLGGGAYRYPDTFYSVMIWCDYGYWLTRVGRRVPQSTPGDRKEVGAAYFASQDESSSSKLMDALRARYVIVDEKIASPIKFFAAASLSGLNEADFYERCWQKKGDKYEPVMVIYPAYYRSMVSRLYSFDGKQVTPTSTLVMEYVDGEATGGQKVKEITAAKNFNSYAEAEAFIAGQKQANYRIIGTDPLASPVPLEALQNYRLAYQSTQKGKSGSTPLPAIKIFEYTQTVSPAAGN